MSDERKKVSGEAKPGKAGRVFSGIIALLAAYKLVDDIFRGTVSGRFHLDSADRAGEPLKFWLYAGVWAFFISVLAWGAIRGFGQKK